jgi:hypothetical protein
MFRMVKTPASPEPDAVLVHVGVHKTGSTWLQRSFFTPRGGGFLPVLDDGQVIGLIVRPHPLEWDPEPARDAIARGIAAARARGLVPVLSQEELSGNPHGGGFASTELARRIAAIAPGARLVVVVRRQPDAIVSTYKQYVRRGGSLDPASYLEPDPTWFRIPRFRLAHWEYDRIVARYRETFGPERTLVLPYEQLAEDRDAFLAALARFAGAAARPAPAVPPLFVSLSALAVATQRRLNRFLFRDDVNPTAPFRWMRLPEFIDRLDARFLRRLSAGHERRLRERVDRRCAGRFEESNARLAAMTGLDLARWDYPLPDRDGRGPGNSR